MSNRALIIGQDELAHIAALKDLAASQPVTLTAMRVLAKGFDPADPASKKGKPRLPQGFTMEIPMGYTATYTVEEQPMGLCRHLSVSVPNEKMPNPAAVQEIMSLFGFETVLGTKMKTSTAIWEEKYAPGFNAINILEKLT